MYKNLFFIFFLISTIQVWSQGKINGRVIDVDTGNPIEGVQVIGIENKINLITDSKGIFVCNNCSQEDTLVLSHLSYETTKIVLKSGKTEIKLTPKTFKLDDVVITGTKAEVIRENVPLSVSTINKVEIEESGESALLPVISDMVPGVFVTERGITGFGVAANSAGQISIRGIGGSPNTQVLMLIDGHPQYMGIMGHPLPDAYVASDAEKVEIIRGPASILYGSGAMGGVINIITKNQDYNGYSVKGRINYGSYNTQKYLLTAGFKKNRFNAFVSFNHDQTDGHRDNSSFNINNGYVKLGYDVNSNIKVYGDLNIAKFKTYDPGPEKTTDSSFITNPHWIDIMRGKASLSIVNSYDKVSGALKLYHNFGEHEIYDGFHSTDVNTGLMLYQSTELFKNNKITAGVDYKYFGGLAENTLAMKGEGLIFGDTIQSELGIYIIDQYNIKDIVTINAGLRMENHSVYGDEMIPQAGFSLKLSKHTTVKSIVSKGFRSPTIRELYLWGPANEDLEPERLINYELAFHQRINEKINFELTGYYIEGDNMIKTLFLNGAPKHMNTGNFIHKGVEFSLNYRIMKNLKFKTNYSYLYMHQPVVASPVNQAFAGFSYRYKKFSLNLNAQYIDQLYTVTTQGMEEMEFYTLLNARFNYEINPYLSVNLSANNLLDEKYAVNYGYPMPGINIMGGISLNLKKF